MCFDTMLNTFVTGGTLADDEGNPQNIVFVIWKHLQTDVEPFVR